MRSRAGNAMARTRSAVLDGAARAVEKHGARRATMADIAALAGVAKGTLYNHFRAKDAVYAAAVQAGVEALAAECATVADDDLGEALATAAERLSGHPALRRVAADDPAGLAALTVIDDSLPWQHVRSSVASVLDAAGRDTSPAAVDVVLRWLVSFVGTPGREVERQAAMLADAIGPRVTVAEEPGAAPDFDDGSIQLTL
ncbi:MAG: TetR/AcrR family transcriptional regulator [Frankiales bacterium]|nr:TetR/AcrR family transcriptional regulator [Frankiales bacterium]